MWDSVGFQPTCTGNVSDWQPTCTGNVSVATCASIRLLCGSLQRHAPEELLAGALPEIGAVGDSSMHCPSFRVYNWHEKEGGTHCMYCE